MILKSIQIFSIAEGYIKKMNTHNESGLYNTTVDGICVVRTVVFRLFQIFAYNSEMIFRIRISEILYK